MYIFILCTFILCRHAADACMRVCMCATGSRVVWAVYTGTLEGRADIFCPATRAATSGSSTSSNLLNSEDVVRSHIRQSCGSSGHWGQVDLCKERLKNNCRTIFFVLYQFY